MIKSTPNSNLLTVADSPFQQHLVSLIIYLYIYKQIQMLLDSPPAPSSRLRSFVAMVLDANAPHLTEESLDYNPVAKCFPPQRLLPTHVASITPSKDGLFFLQLATRKSQLSLLGRISVYPFSSHPGTSCSKVRETTSMLF